jgi:hypothetical protein
VSSENYSRVIREWCAATGMQAWAAHEDMHISIGETLVGLIHNNSETPELLHVYIDLGHWERPDLYRILLEENTPLNFDDHGCFGLHPITGSIVYRSQKLLSDEISGTNFLEEIKQLIHVAKTRLENSLMQ